MPPVASDMDVSEAAGDEGNLVICRKAPLGELRHVPLLVQELLQILTEARRTSLSKSKLWKEGKDLAKTGFLVVKKIV